MPKAKARVRIISAWGERKSAGGVAGGVKPVRPVLELARPVWGLQSGKSGLRAREESRFVSGGRGSGGWSGELVGGQFAMRFSSHVIYGNGRNRSFEMERRDDPRFSFHGFGPSLGREWGFLGVVTEVVFVVVVYVGEMVWCVLTPISSELLGTGFTLLVLTPVLSRLFAHVLVF
jgi:hypothetical protein